MSTPCWHLARLHAQTEGYVRSKGESVDRNNVCLSSSKGIPATRGDRVVCCLEDSTNRKERDGLASDSATHTVALHLEIAPHIQKSAHSPCSAKIARHLSKSKQVIHVVDEWKKRRGQAERKEKREGRHVNKGKTTRQSRIKDKAILPEMPYQ